MAADSKPAGDPPRLVLVQWHGQIGGAEVLAVDLASSMLRLGVEAEVVFVSSAERLGERLATAKVPFRELGFTRGRDILLRPRRYAAGVVFSSPQGVLLPECGFIGAALRLGGYRGRIIAVEHGALLTTPSSKRRGAIRQLNRIAGAWADDVEVGVSEFALARMRRGPHAPRLCRIYNGIDPARFVPATHRHPAETDGELVVGFAGRLIPGKGADDSIRAVAAARNRIPIKLLIAGDGPDRPRLQSIAQSLGTADRVEFLGMVSDMSEFWERCDVAIFASNQLIESFGMAALEAMACAKPVLATRNGGAPELVVDRATGTIVGRGSVGALTQALVTYAE